MICGNRVRVEHSTGRVRPKFGMRGGRGPPRRAFRPDDRCYECGERGHYAYDCYKYRRGGGGRSSRRSYSRSRSHSRSRSRGHRRSRSQSRSASKSRSRSPAERKHSRSRSGSRRKDSPEVGRKSDS